MATANFGRLDFSITDSSGNASSGASVEVRLQGATVNGDQTITSGQSVTVFDCGAIQSTDVCEVYSRDPNSGTSSTKRTASGGASQFSVGTVTATTIPLSGFSGTLALTSGDRITLATSASAALTLKKQAHAGDDFSSTTLTTDTNGQAYCYATCGYYDYVASGGSKSLTATLFTDKYAAGQNTKSNGIYSGVQSGYIFDTYRTQTAGQLFRIANSGTAKLTVSGAATGTVTVADGLAVTAGGVTVTAGGITVTAGGLTVTAGGLTVSASGITVTGNSTITGTLTSLTGITSSGTAAFSAVTSSGGITVSASGINVTGGITVSGSTGITQSTSAVMNTFANLKTSGEWYLMGKETIASGTTINVSAGTTLVQLTGSTTVTTINLNGGAPGASDDGRVLFIRDSDATATTVGGGGGNITTGVGAKSVGFGESIILRYNHSATSWEYICKM